MEQSKFEYEKELKTVELEMTKQKALADINMSGAQVQGNLASSALNALNSVVSAAVTEDLS